METHPLPTDPADEQPDNGEAEQARTAHPRVLVADDDPSIRELLELILSDDGYEVISAANGHELVQLAQERAPWLILVDLMMPQMDGYEAIRQMRNDTRTAHIPMLILTSRACVGDVVVGFETGADDYIAKPFDISELLARVRRHLHRATQRPVLNPLTGLPGSLLLSEELRHRLARGAPLALLYADLDNFKAFNDTYGFARGDRAILLVASTLKSVLAAYGNFDDFIGHIGGDDFAVLTTPDRAEAICVATISAFDQEVLQLYTPEDQRRGYLFAADRHGILRRFDLVSISIGVVTTERRGFQGADEITRVAAEMKHYAKTQPGSSYAVDQRSTHNPPDVERRGLRQRGVLLISEDASLRSVLLGTLRDEGYSVQEALSIAAARAILDQESPPALMLADAQLGPPLWQLCAELAGQSHAPPIIVLAHTDAEVAPARAAGASVVLRQPLPLADIILCVEQTLASCSDRAGQAVRARGAR